MKVLAFIVEVLLSCVYLVSVPIYLVIALIGACVSSAASLSTTPIKVTYRAVVDGLWCLRGNAHNPERNRSAAMYLQSFGAVLLKCAEYSVRKLICKYARYHGIHKGYGWYGIMFSYPEDARKDGEASGIVVTLYGDITRYTYSHEFVHVGQLFRYGLFKNIQKKFIKHKLGCGTTMPGYSIEDVDNAITVYTDSGVLNELEIEAVLIGTHTPLRGEFDAHLGKGYT